jgi:hypothetical protein
MLDVKFGGRIPKIMGYHLLWVEFAYNMSQNLISQSSPFEILYKQNPSSVIKITHVPRIRWLSVQTDGT